MKALIFFLAASLLLAACNIVRVDSQPSGAAVTIYQGAWKSAVGRENAVEATTSPATKASLK